MDQGGFCVSCTVKLAALIADSCQSCPGSVSEKPHNPWSYHSFPREHYGKQCPSSLMHYQQREQAYETQCRINVIAHKWVLKENKEAAVSNRCSTPCIWHTSVETELMEQKKQTSTEVSLHSEHLCRCADSLPWAKKSFWKLTGPDWDFHYVTLDHLSNCNISCRQICPFTLCEL